jgi:hypothetical protein
MWPPFPCSFRAAPVTPQQGAPAAKGPHVGIKEISMTHPSTTPLGATGGNAFAFARTGYDQADMHSLTTADVESATVYGRDDETVGTISALKVGTDGKITDAVIDVGGFLGMGAHSVQLPFSDLTVLRETDGSDVRVHLGATKEQLKAMPHHAA